ncbi:hypothetical protein [Pseudonocardia sp. H11422]|uniref:hypothetical protein n=1 Tax=Pseudonocardia sp. H11422 TaxID=2835866 RepID=UPI001BDC80A4|nr:hypothetical protein [Pseudonocardia sp. H11422]
MFSGTTTNPGNGWRAGTVDLVDGLATATFAADNLEPGSTGTKCVVVSSTGTPAGAALDRSGPEDPDTPEDVPGPRPGPGGDDEAAAPGTGGASLTTGYTVQRAIDNGPFGTVATLGAAATSWKDTTVVDLQAAASSYRVMQQYGSWNSAPATTTAVKCGLTS